MPASLARLVFLLFERRSEGARAGLVAHGARIDAGLLDPQDARLDALGVVIEVSNIDEWRGGGRPDR